MSLGGCGVGLKIGLSLVSDSEAFLRRLGLVGRRIFDQDTSNTVITRQIIMKKKQMLLFYTLVVTPKVLLLFLGKLNY